MIGVYKITNLFNNKVYIGSSKNIPHRQVKHFQNLKYNIHINKHLQAAYNKYGKENFKFEIIRLVSESILRKAEQFYINKYQALNPKYGYNKTIVESNKWDNLEKIEKVQPKIYFGCYDKNGKIVKVFKHIKDVCLFLNKSKATRVYVSCDSNFARTAHNYYWLRLDVNKFTFPKSVTLKDRLGRHRKVFQYDLNNNFIKEWPSAVEAGKNLNFRPESITKALKSSKKYKGYKWYYSPI